LRKNRLLRIIAQEVLPPDKRNLIICGFDIIGDIAILKIPSCLKTYEHDIAHALLRKLPYVKVVLKQASAVRGRYRLRAFEWLAGERRTWTVCKEYGCIFKVDLSKVFYTPRLSHEHMRIAKLVRRGEVVINMFAGIGPFSIIIAKYSKAKKVYSIDINPHAYKLMVENVEINKVKDVVVPMFGDAARIIITKLRHVADRVLMPLPELGLKYLPFAVIALRKDGGWIHTYLHVFYERGIDPLIKAMCSIALALESLGLTYDIMGARIVRDVGPRLVQVVLDILIKHTTSFSPLHTPSL